MLKILIAIPSKGRVEAIKKKTLSWLRGTIHDVAIFVEPSEFQAYCEAVSGPWIKIVNTGQDNSGTMHSKAVMKLYANANGYDAIFKLDDDIGGWRGPDRKQTDSLGTFENAIKDSLEVFETQPDVKAISFPYGFQMFKIAKWLSINARLQGCYIVRTDWMYADIRYKLIEDFANFVYIRAKNGITLRYGHAGMNIDSMALPGGELSAKKKENMEQAIELLRELHPALKVRKVEGKPWDYEPDFRDKFFAGKAIK